LFLESYFHSVTLDEKKCKGCTNCIKRCPTEAIRVRKSKARIINERCIDCGECIRVCPYHAKKAITDSLEIIKSFKYKIALPAPTLYGQYDTNYTRNKILNGLKLLGFDDVYEVARGAEIVSYATKKLLEKGDYEKPLISSACPAVVRLIQVRFPSLINNLVKIQSPMEVSALMARKKAMELHHLSNDEIGVFFITPCAAKVTSIKAPYEKEKSAVNGAISIKDIYLNLLNNMDKSLKNFSLEQSGIEGIRWAGPGGEALGLSIDNYIAVDGIHNVIRIFEEIEKDRLEDIEFVEALACVGGCLGGPLTVENAYLARSRLKKHMKEIEKMESLAMNMQNEEFGIANILTDNINNLEWKENIQHRPIMKLDEDISKAIRKLEELERINESLPGLDCGACGAPSCRALAEDIVREIADETDCIFKLREKVRHLAIQMSELESKMPPVLDKEQTYSNDE
jgi:iron only hydrogenase large subunit-like protein